MWSIFFQTDESSNLSDSQLQDAGLPDSQSIFLFRQFLTLYNYKGKGLKDISDLENRSEEEINSLLELMHLPGVNNIRANLYYQCGLKSLKDFVVADADELQKKIAEQIKEKGLQHCGYCDKYPCEIFPAEPSAEELHQKIDVENQWTWDEEKLMETYTCKKNMDEFRRNK